MRCELVLFVVFFFKQKTAYEMRISDWIQTCALPISDLTEADLTRADLRGALLESVNMAGANLTGVNFRRGLEIGANPSAAIEVLRQNVTGSNFEGATMIGVDALGADFSGSDLADRKSTRLNSSH